jgi:hypothetical protein
MLTYTDCIVGEGGYPTQDGYIRVLTKPRKDGGKLMMLHRLEWEKVYGQIPEGYTVDHKCKNRQCQNVNHMQLLPAHEHAAKDNGQRYLQEILTRLNWIAANSGLVPKDVAKSLGVSRGYVEELSRRYPEIREHLDMRKRKDNGKREESPWP